MPLAPKRPCLHPGCPAYAVTRGRCAQHAPTYDRQRGTRHERGYTSKWEQARAAYLARPAHALCVRCAAQGRTTPATVVDHVVPHRGDHRLFWDRDNWQPLCARCHNQKTAREDGGFGA